MFITELIVKGGVVQDYIMIILNCCPYLTTLVQQTRLYDQYTTL